MLLNRPGGVLVIWFLQESSPSLQTHALQTKCYPNPSNVILNSRGGPKISKDVKYVGLSLKEMRVKGGTKNLEYFPLSCG